MSDGDQIPTPDPDLFPIGMILPFPETIKVPGEWLVMDGQIVFEEDYPEFVGRMARAYDNRDPDTPVFDFWTQYGGVICNWFVTLPTIPSEKVIELAFGVSNYLPPEAKPVLAIKVQRIVSSDGASEENMY